MSGHYQEVWVENEPCEELHISDKAASAMLRVYDHLRRAELPRPLRIDVNADLDLIEPLVHEIERYFLEQQRMNQKAA